MKIAYRYKNRYGCTTLACIIDTEKRTATLYRGMTAPISEDWKNRTRGDVYCLYRRYVNDFRYTAIER